MNVARVCFLLVLLLRCSDVAALSAPWPELVEIFPSATQVGPVEEPGARSVYRDDELLGYAFDTGDLVSIPGFAGTPIDMLVGLTPAGEFTGVRVLDHNEPIFLHGVGLAKMEAFIRQYLPTLSLRRNIKVRTGLEGDTSGSVNDYIDGVTKATASVTIMNDTVLLAAFKVARRKIAELAGNEPADVRADLFTSLTWDELVASGHVARAVFKNADVEAGFADTEVAGIDEAALARPQALFSELFVTYLNPPTVGRNILGDADYQRLMTSELEPGEHAFLVAANGPYSYRGEDYVPGSVFDRLDLTQNELSLEMRDTDFYNFHDKHTPHLPAFNEFTIFRHHAQSVFDPASPWQIALNVRRTKGFLHETFTTRLPVQFTPDKSLYVVHELIDATAREPAWVGIWRTRSLDVTITLLGLLVVSAVFVFQHALARRERLFRTVRWGYLFFTLFFIGWYAQGQLSVVNIFPIARTPIDGFAWSTYLIDPIVFILWSFTFVTLFLWGRGVFCGWLCPFGALQEMVAWVATKLRIRQWRIREATHRKMWFAKYVLLAGLVGTALYSPNAAFTYSEVEPFKTAITEVFARNWMFVTYAVVLLGLGLFVHKFYCRYLCALGAGLAIIGKLRRFEWLRRYDACGQPCQYCARVCGVESIEKSGAINYDECIQCFECIAVYHAENRCVIRINERKRTEREVQFEPRLPVTAFPSSQHV